MAQKTVVLFEDDLNGGTADETVSFSLDGVAYEMDLSAANAAAFRAVFDPYVKAGRRIGGRRSTTPTRTGTGARTQVDRDQVAAIRTWAANHGLQINTRGRIPGHIVEQYHAAAAAPAQVAATVAPARRRTTRKTS